MQQPYHQNPWDPQPPESEIPAPRNRAAVVLWVIAGAQLLLSMCCCGLWTAILALPQQVWDQAVQQQNAPPQMVADMRRLAPVAIAAVLGLGILPAVAYAVLAFGVRAGKAMATNTAILIALTQSIVLGIMLLMGVVGGVAQASPTDVTLNVLVFGSMLALLIYAIRLLLTVRRGTADELASDPWDQIRR